MSAWLQSESAYYVIAIALLALGALLLLRGWIGHRARGVPRCRRCYYSLAGSPTLACPECGRTHRNERDALRPRRYWKRGVLGLVLAAIGAYALFSPDIAQRRSELKEDWYIAVVPTTVWIALLPQLTLDQIDMLDARLFGDDAAWVWKPSGIIFQDDDIGQFSVDHTDYRPLTEIDRIPAWQCRLLARRCIDVINEPLPSKAEIESNDPAVVYHVSDLDWRRLHVIHWLASVRRHHDDAMPLLLRVLVERRHFGHDRDVAVQVLSVAGEATPDLIEVLIRCAMDSPGKTIQRITLESFKRWRDSDPRIIAALKPLLDSHDSRIREPVLEALGNLRPVTPELIALLRGEVLRRADQFDPASIKAMARLGEPALPALLEDLRRLPDPETEQHRHYLVPLWVLEEMGAVALPAIFKLMDDDDESTALRALQFIEQNAKLPREALPLLRDRLKRELDRKKIDVLLRAIKEVEARR